MRAARVMFHVEQTWATTLPAFGQDGATTAPLDKFGAGAPVVVRRRFIFGGTCAIISAQSKNVKSFLRGRVQLIRTAQVCKKRRADYTVVVRRCQVLFAQLPKIIRRAGLW